MNILEQVSNEPKQSLTIEIEDGTKFTMAIKFIEMQTGWFITKLVYEDFEINNMRVCNSPNILHQFRNQLPFGLACISVDKREPSFLDDFEDRQSIFYLLTQQEVDDYEVFLRG